MSLHIKSVQHLIDLVSSEVVSGSVAGKGSFLGLDSNGNTVVVTPPVSSVENGANNRVATFSSTEALNGEENLTFDGSVLTVAGDISGSGKLQIAERIEAKDLGITGSATIRGNLNAGKASSVNHIITGSAFISGSSAHTLEIFAPTTAVVNYSPLKIKAEESAFATNTIAFAGTGSALWEVGTFGPNWDDVYKNSFGLALPHVNNCFIIQNNETEHGIRRAGSAAALGGKTHGNPLFSINYSGSVAIGTNTFANGALHGRLYVNANEAADKIGQLIIGPTDAGKSSGDLNSLFVSGAIKPIPGGNNSFLINATCTETAGSPLFYVSSSGEAMVLAVGKGHTGGHNGGNALFVWHSGTLAPGGSGAGGSEKDTGILVRAGEGNPSGQGKCVYLQFQDGDGDDGGGIRCGSTVANPELFNGSDIRIKTDINPTQIKGLETINGLELIEYRWNPLYRYNTKLNKIGFSAQNCEQVYPEMVAEDPNVHEKFGFKIKSIAKAELIPILVKAVQELSAEVEELKKKIK
tara:strand:- start:597 stop:2165 length:1569 start_codon:yes stop_codon:yes gene_type:complete